MAPQYITVQAGKTYKIVKKPDNVKSEDYPILGMSGVCRWTSSIHGACLDIAGEETIISFENIEEMDVTESVDDGFLITTILADPDATLRLLRGLWRMTKHTTIRDFMERGKLPGFEDKIIPKTKKEYEEDWDEYFRSTGMLVSGS